jgi:Na+-translocating ferredoxin:NAD+ oxidoreductase RnfA subunit
MSEIALFAILAVLSLNLVLHTGLGIKEIYQDSNSSFTGSLLRWVSLFAVVFLLWLLWTFVFSPLSLGFFDVIFIFPLCALAFYAIDEYILKHKSLTHFNANGNAISMSTPLCVFSLFMTLRLASTVAEAALLSLFFSVGCILASLILSSILLRMKSEPVSKKITGIPLAFISNGLLALIFSAAATILLRQ